MCDVQVVHCGLRRSSLPQALCLVEFLVLDLIRRVAALAHVEGLRRKHAVVLGWAVIHVCNLWVCEGLPCSLLLGLRSQTLVTIYQTIYQLLEALYLFGRLFKVLRQALHNASL